MQCRRGMLELDFIFEQFLDCHYSQLTSEQKKLLSQLLNQEDPTLYDWLVVDLPCTDVTLQPIVDLIKKSFKK